MDSSSVTKELRRVVWPLLKGAGFAAAKTRTLQRHSADWIDVVNFQSFNSYNADVMRVTTFSFAVNLGRFLRYVPPQWSPAVKDGIPYPKESECQFRRQVTSSLSQPRHVDKAIWFVEEGGKNLGWCVNAVAQTVPNMLDWFARLDDHREVLRILREDEERMPDLWGFGRKPSPVRSYLTAYVALRLGQEQLADEEFGKAIASECFNHLFSSIKGARLRAV